VISTVTQFSYFLGNLAGGLAGFYAQYINHETMLVDEDWGAAAGVHHGVISTRSLA